MKKRRSYYPCQNDHKQEWFVIDAEDKIVGRVASKVARIVKGKESCNYTPGVNLSKFVVVINAERVKVTGNKENKKIYYRHSGHPGGLKETLYKDVMKKDPTGVLSFAIKGMLPHNTYGRKLFQNIKIYKGDDHPHDAQKPTTLNGF